ncbi:MAG: putative rane spanning protein [Gammaproteobacteria bacterium]|nr:putative rane spanning protein [Gammaproteobacteria bacterium]
MIIFRYLIKEVYGTLLASTLVLLLLLISNQLVHYLTQAAAGVVPLRTVMQIMSLQIPLLLGLLLPLGLYLGILMGYGRLYADQEMTVLSACGMSRGQLIKMTLLFSSVIAMIVALLMLWLQPKVEGYKRQIIIDAAASSPLERISPGEFIQFNDQNIIFYAESLSRDHKDLDHIFVAQKNMDKTDPSIPVWNIVIADEGRQIVDSASGDKFLVLGEGHRYQGTPGKADFQIAKYATYGIRIAKDIVPQDNRVEAIPTTQLWAKRNQSPEYNAELQWRIAVPLSTLILALLAIPLSKVNPRQGRYAQLLPAFLLYIIYADLIFVGMSWIESGKASALWGMWWVHGSMLSLALILLAFHLEWIRFPTLTSRKNQ